MRDVYSHHVQHDPEADHSMSYQALARKWRPRRFEDLVGQQHVVRALSHALADDKLHHALLFSGTRGVGKTTLARIISKCLNCERTDHVTATPCVDDDACATCREIDDGRFVDLIEVDAASRTGVDDMRELMENVHYAPTRGRTKVYLIDEVHMLSKHAFNALLKTLEEPPPSVQFLFATTEPEKLPVTILSRCLHFPLKRLPVPQIAAQMTHILEAERQQADSEAVDEIARVADGSLRDGLSLLDQAIAFGGGTVAVADVRNMLGTVGQAQVRALIEAIVAADARAALQALDNAYAQGMEMRYLLETMATAWQAVATQQLLGTSETPEQTDWTDLAERMVPADVHIYYDIALAGLRDLTHAPDPLVGVRMSVLRMLAFTPGGDSSPLHAQSQGSRNQEQSKQAPESDAQDSAATLQPASAGGRGPDETAGPKQATPPPAQVGDWTALVRRLGLTGMTAQLAANGTCRDLGEDVITLELPRAHEHLATESARKKLQQALDAHWQPANAPRLKISIVASAEDAPARQAEQAADARQQQAVRAIENDPTVRQLQQRLGAQLRPDSIKPNNTQ